MVNAIVRGTGYLRRNRKRPVFSWSPRNRKKRVFKLKKSQIRVFSDWSMILSEEQVVSVKTGRDVFLTRGTGRNAFVFVVKAVARRNRKT